MENCIRNLRERSSKLVTDFGGRLSNHFIATFVKVVTKALQRVASEASASYHCRYCCLHSALPPPLLLPPHHTFRSSALLRFVSAPANYSGLGYLHSNEASKPTMVHQNILVEKVLLDNQFNPLIMDAGFPKLLADDIVYSAPKVGVAMGYLAPEYITTGRITEKSDVYAFGVIVL
ncbi:proline-rich receptor-like protein kinase PERK3 [Arachis stenosperma]|uniref:proline-rich receptor-like protein kinase PERK3 n=1 Tax=Arachis stenosperma TaxID=217475 RepID=UPI0025ACB24A|nr:proline-rich receptor-like protein kinase PERK3 [Arachis stenosperma]